MSDIQEIWEQSSALIKTQIAEDCYERWIASIVPVRQEDNALVLGVPSGIFSAWLTDNFKDVITDAVKTFSKQITKVRFEDGHATPLEDETPQSSAKVKNTKAKKEEKIAKETSVKPVRHLEPESSIVSLDRRFTFDTFVVGDNCKFAYSACRSVSNTPGVRLNPLFIHSSTGLGKTHLLQGIAQEVIRNNPRAKVLYVNSEDFLNQFIEAMYKNKFPEFRKKFRELDVLLLDDVQFIGTKQGFQEEVFHTFNSLYNSHKQIVMTSDRPPHEIGGLEKRLVSRFEWGLTTEILPPDFETRVAIIHKKQEEQDYKLDEDVVNYVAARLKSNIRRLESAIFKLVSWASLSSVKIDIPTAEKLLSDVINEEAGSMLSVEDIQRVVAEYYDIRLADMTSKRRPANIALPRQIAMFFARKMTGLSLPAIAEKFSKNHATILHAVTTIEDKIVDNVDFKRELGQIERKLKNV